jgi:hypothetical protein
VKKFFHRPSPIATDGKVFFSSATGIISLIQAGDSFKFLARNKLLEPITAPPAMADDKIYVRNRNRIMGFWKVDLIALPSIQRSVE